MKYTVTIRKTSLYTIDLWAEDEENAERKALDGFENNYDEFELVKEDYEVEDIDEC